MIFGILMIICAIFAQIILWMSAPVFWMLGGVQ